MTALCRKMSYQPHTKRLQNAQCGLLVFQKVSFIYYHSILLKKRAVFLGKRHFMVMFLLAHYITYYHILVMQTIAETGILSAPTSKMREQWVTIHPFASTRLHSLHKF